MSGRDITFALGTAAGAFLAAGLIQLATSPIAHANGDAISISPGIPDPDFIYNTTNFGLFTDIAAADPDEHFDAMVLQIPSLGITDVLTGGIDPSDGLTSVPGLSDVGTLGAGTVDVTVNTFQDSMNPALDGTFTIPFTDPLIELWIALLPLGF